MKSRFSLWGPMEINGSPRWGVNEMRYCETYTHGPRNGWDTRRAAMVALRAARAVELLHEKEVKFLAAHPL